MSVADVLQGSSLDGWITKVPASVGSFIELGWFSVLPTS